MDGGMSNLEIQSMIIPAVDAGVENPLVPIGFADSTGQITYSPDLPHEMLENMAYGRLNSVYPYTMQDGYERALTPRDFQVAILENEYLRATFLLDYGGRLWSLIHKPSGKELLETNSVFQLANLALRNAWFSGGVEWNLGTIGHSPFTCSPLFSCRVEAENGSPFLRFYEWERFRQTPFQLDAFLPDGSQVLLIRTRIINPNNHPVPIYWWSNIAVPETPKTRVITPARSAYCLGCHPNKLERIEVPSHQGVDITYPKQLSAAADFFFDLEATQFPWITALDGNGQGLIQLSTHHMVGRKLWVWGSSPGGRNWQKFLSPDGNGYIEIQSGITKTQLEHKLLAANGTISWLEAYGFMQADPLLVHGKDWFQAYQHVNEKIEALVTPDEFLGHYQQAERYFDLPPVEFFRTGSGWGALESRRREVLSEEPLNLQGLVFAESSLTEKQEPWVSLLETGAFPAIDPEIPFGSFVAADIWGEIIEKSVQKPADENWYGWYQCGISRMQLGNLEGAEVAFSRSLEICWTPWAARNLAVLSWRQGELDRAAYLLVEACHAAPQLIPLAVECGTCLIEAGRELEWLQLVQGLPLALQSNGRIQLLQAQAALACGDFNPVEEFIRQGMIVADLREGENSISDLWIEYQVQRLCRDHNLADNDPLVIQFRKNPPVPEEFDFRMRS
jgi:hypothetical protein